MPDFLPKIRCICGVVHIIRFGGKENGTRCSCGALVYIGVFERGKTILWCDYEGDLANRKHNRPAFVEWQEVASE